MTYELVSSDLIINIPPEVAICPYCDTKLTAQFTGWTEADDGSGWMADEVDWDCESEPDFDSEEYDDWLDQHTEMPYVYRLPICQKIEKWVNERYRFDLHPIANLEAWTEAVKDWKTGSQQDKTPY
jgi:hypothetical protein